MRKRLELDIANLNDFRKRLTQFLEGKDHVCWMDSCDLSAAGEIQEFDILVGFGALSHLSLNHGKNLLEQLHAYHQSENDWIMGGLSYDLKNDLHIQLQSNNKEAIPFPNIYFFRPETVLQVKGTRLLIESIYDPTSIIREIEKKDGIISKPKVSGGPIRSTVDEKTYRKTIARIKEEIRDGNVYEVNYCLNNIIDLQSPINSLGLYHRLQQVSPAPFSVYLRMSDLAVLSSSPERYIRKEGRRIISQPIKGTRPRSQDPEQDHRFKQELQNSLKERAENVMIVDLVRNDLAHTCKAGSVKVRELFGLYSYEQVHQMVSTIEGQLKDENNWTDVLRHSFPMGSMTGAPKIAAMSLIDEIEDFKRGWYSGTVGYVSPEGNFDFNVIIRSMLYSASLNKLSYSVGGAITYDSTAEEEWNECALKATAIRQLFSD